MTVQTAARNLLISLLMGALLGVWHGFLRPLRTKGTVPADILFVLAALWAELEFGFGICRGDLRSGYFFGAMAAAVAADRILGLPLLPVFAGFWKSVAAILRLILLPLKKSLKKAKILFASGEKWVTIKWYKHWHHPASPGGKSHGKKESPEKRKGRYQTQSSGSEDRADCAYSIVYGGVADHPAGTQRHSGRNSESER